MEAVMEGVGAPASAQRYTVRISLVRVDDAGKVVQECYDIRLNSASTDYGAVDNIVDRIVEDAEEAWTVLFEGGTSTPLNLAWGDGAAQLAAIRARPGEEIQLVCDACNTYVETLSPEEAAKLEDAIMCSCCGAALQVEYK